MKIMYQVILLLLALVLFCSFIYGASEQNLFYHIDFEQRVSNLASPQLHLTKGSTATYDSDTPNSSWSSYSLNCQDNINSYTYNVSQANLWDYENATISFWTKLPSATSENFEDAFAVGSTRNDSVSGVYSFVASAFSDSINPDFSFQGSGLWAPTEKRIFPNWQMITYIMNRSGLHMYVNLTFHESDEDILSFQNWTKNQVEVCNFEGHDRAYSGLIDDIRMYDTSLNPTDLARLYHQGKLTSGLPDIDLTVDTPENGTVFFENNFSDEANLIWLNFTSNSSGANISINDTLNWTLSSNSSTEHRYVNKTPLSFQRYWIRININQTGTNNATSTLYFDHWGYPFYDTNKTNQSSVIPKKFEDIYMNLSLNRRGDTLLDTYRFSWNGTNGSWVNDSLVEINSIEENISIVKNVNTSRGHIGWIVYFNDTNGLVNQSEIFIIEVRNTEPTLGTVNISQKVLDTDNLNCNLSFTDNDNDSVVFYNVSWYVNGTIRTPLSIYNRTNLSFENTTNGDIWSCSMSIYDGFNYSSIVSSENTTVGDLSLPVINQTGVTPTSISSGQSINLSANITDVDSDIDSVIFEVENNNSVKENVSGTLIGLNGVNVQTQWSRIYTPTAIAGTWYVKTYTRDGSGNWQSTGERNLSFVVSVSGGGAPTGGGGGGGGPQTQCSNDEDCIEFGDKYICIQSFCVFQEKEDLCNFNGICEPERGENPFNCGDERVNGSVISEGDCSLFSDFGKLATNSEIFIWFVLIVVIGGSTLALSQSQKGSVVNRKIKPSFKRYLRRIRRR